MTSYPASCDFMVQKPPPYNYTNYNNNNYNNYNYNQHARPSAPPIPRERTTSSQSRLNFLINKYEISPLFSEKISVLKNFEIVFLLDDSGSMNTKVDNTSKTRWIELREVVKTAMEVATIYDKNGIDIYFLNRDPHRNIKNFDTINHIFSQEPMGLTPLTENLEKIFESYKNCDKPVLVVIATDGVPTNFRGQSDIESFRRCLDKRDSNKFFISILACSDVEKDIEYLNKIDKKVKNVDVIDDYISEKKEVLAVQGRHFKYTIGDHVLRLLLGSIFPEFDKLDERQNCRCTIL